MAEQINKFLRFSLSIDAKLSKKFMSDFSGLVAGSRDYLKIKVEMPDAFKQYAAAVVYTTGGNTYNRPLTGGVCAVPNEVAAKTNFAVSLVLQNGSQRIYTNKVEVYQSGRYES